jgi:hypothetical protein
MLFIVHFLYMLILPAIYVRPLRAALFWLSLALAVRFFPFPPCVWLACWLLLCALVSRYLPAISGAGAFLQNGICGLRESPLLLVFEILTLLLRGFLGLFFLLWALEWFSDPDRWLFLYGLEAVWALSFVGILTQVLAVAVTLSVDQPLLTVLRHFLPSLLGTFPLGGWTLLRWIVTLLLKFVPRGRRLIARVPSHQMLQGFLRSVPTVNPIEKVIDTIPSPETRGDCGAPRELYRRWNTQLPVWLNDLVFVVVASLLSGGLSSSSTATGRVQVIVIMTCMEFAVSFGVAGDLAAISYAVAVQAAE